MSGSVVNFQEIPSPWEVPSTLVEVVPGYANVGILPIPARTLIIAGVAASSFALTGTINPNITRPIDARGLGGPGSTTDRMVAAYLAVNQTIPLDVICLDDAAGSTAAVTTITFPAANALTGGTCAIAIEGTRIAIGVLAGDQGSTLAIELAAAINAMPMLPVTATFTLIAGGGAPFGGYVTCTAKNKGLTGNDISFVLYPALGDAPVPGVRPTIVSTTPGATNPSIAAALTTASLTWYTDIIIAWQDSPNLTLLNADLERRWRATTHQDARGHVGVTGTFSQQLSAASALNARFIYFAPMTKPGSAPWALAAAAGGLCAQWLTQDPSRQLNHLALTGIVGSQPVDRADDLEKELLLTGGCSVFHTARDGTVSMQRYASTYTINANADLDKAWHDVMEQAVASRIRYDWRVYRAELYPRNKQAPDGSLAAANDPSVLTPRKAKASWTARMMIYAKNGWVVDEVNQANAAFFVIDPNDANRMNAYMPYTRIGNLIVDAGQLVFNVGGE